MMEYKLKETIQNILNLAYPHPWTTALLSLPLEQESKKSIFNFHVICSDVPSAYKNEDWWPPSSQNSTIWFRWELRQGTGFWIRPRKYDPILRDRLILLEPCEFVESMCKSRISRQGLLDASYFAAQSGRLIWNNSSKSGANSPKSAHFQSMPVRWQNDCNPCYTLPCFNHQSTTIPWTSTKDVKYHILERGLRRDQYPVLGLVVWGPIIGTVDRVWEVIWNYDKAQACNLIIQPADNFAEDIIRIFVFPRSRDVKKYLVTEELVMEDEKILLNNNRGGKWEEWPFAGVEMGLLTQVEWAGVFDEMRSNPKKWGRTLLRILQELTPKETDKDWLEFIEICRPVFKV